MLKWIGTYFRTFLWALIMALAVWVAAVVSADPDEVRSYPESVPVEIIGQDSSLIITSEIPEQIELSLRAPVSVWDELLTEDYEIQAILDLSGLDVGEHTLEIQIQIPVQPVRIISVTPRTATVALEKLSTQTVPITLGILGDPAIGYQAGEATVSPDEVTVSGSQSQVERLVQVRASVQLTEARDDIDKLVNLQPLDENNQIIQGLTINPSEVLVSLPISQQGGYRDLAVKLVVNGQIASGYRLTNISVFPPVVTIYSGDPSLVNSLPSTLETQPLDLNNADGDLTTHLAINLPEGVSLVGDQTVFVRVNISPIQGSLSISNKEIEIEGLPGSWFAKVAPETVDVILSGPLPLLDTLSPQEVRVSIDATGLDEGTYQLTPDVEILVSDILVESILPGTVELIISKTSLETPAP